MISEELVEELIEDYAGSKYKQEELRKMITTILESIVPKLSSSTKTEKFSEQLWERIRKDGEIEKAFQEITKKVDRAIVIFVASKFLNNRYFGQRILEEAIKND